MGFIDSVLDKKALEDKKKLEEILSGRIGKKLPKKLRKKLRWKKVAPMLSLIISVLAHFLNVFQGQQSRPPDGAAKKQPATRPPTRPQPVDNKMFDNPTLQAHVDRAIAYRSEIERLAQSGTNRVEGERVQDLAVHVQTWTEAIIELARRVDGFQRNKLINQDLKTVPKSIAALETRLSEATDPMLRAELERTLTNRRKQLAALEKLQQTIQWAEVKIESTLSLLGTIYSQILAGQSKNHVADYRHLLNDIDEEVLTLQDYLEALEEVKFTRV